MWFKYGGIKYAVVFQQVHNIETNMSPRSVNFKSTLIECCSNANTESFITLATNQRFTVVKLLRPVSVDKILREENSQVSLYLNYNDSTIVRFHCILTTTSQSQSVYTVIKPMSVFTVVKPLRLQHSQASMQLNYYDQSRVRFLCS